VNLERLIDKAESLVFGNRKLLLVSFAILTLLMGYFASQLRVDAGFSKLLPLQHPYMKTFVKYKEEFGGANRILIALMTKEGDIFTPEFFKTLKAVTDEVFFIPGVDRAQVKSLFTPNVRFIEIVEDGFAGGDVVPADFQPTPEGLSRVRTNIIKAGQVGRLVAKDFSGAMISANLLEIHPTTGKRLNPIEISKKLEEIRKKFETQNIQLDIHIIGFAKVIGDVAEGAAGVIVFFLIAFVITAILVYLYSLSAVLTFLPLFCSLIAVTWQLGLLTIIGFGIDPMSILVPFLVFAIGVSHGVQMINAVRGEIFLGTPSQDAARNSFRRLLIPGGVALISDTIGFLTILLIDIEIIQETAITASLGVAVIILTNLILLPLLLSYVKLDKKYRDTVVKRAELLNPLWGLLYRFAKPRVALITVAICGGLFVFSLWQATQVRIGDLHQGVPELRADSRYNKDTAIITDRFSIGVDILSVIAETKPDGCIDYDIMETIDRFSWTMRNVEGVHSVITLPSVAKIINAGWNEGNLKWRILPRNQQVMVQAITPVDTSTGLLNNNCTAMPVLIFTSDHKAETITRIVTAVKNFAKENDRDDLHFKLATGNVGVMAATNEAVDAAQFPMLIYVYAAIIALCILTFRSIRATICIVAPLALVSALAYALMAYLEIGLKVSTLPVVALGVGIGVDYGIYIYSRLQERLKVDDSIETAYLMTLQIAGNAVLFTGITLAIGVGTWIFSDLKFQADMGILLTFMFLVNMLAAVILLPALAALLLKVKPKPSAVN